jgi:polyisoprenoid-binding protein YceI
MNLMNLNKLCLGLASQFLAITILHAAPLQVDLSKSTVSATFKQMNVPVDANFKKFTAIIDFDANKLEAAKASIDIHIPSFDLGDPDYNHEVQKKEWFNGAQFPKASFVSSKIKSISAGKFEASGKLTIKGKTVEVAFPLTLKKEGLAQIFEGSLPIRRLTYSIGEGEWKDTSIVADEVIIKFRIVTSK